MENLKLNDSVIAHLAKLLQLSIITGTDIVDHMRQIRVAVEDNGTTGTTGVSDGLPYPAANIQTIFSFFPPITIRVHRYNFCSAHAVLKSFI